MDIYFGKGCGKGDLIGPDDDTYAGISSIECMCVLHGPMLATWEAGQEYLSEKNFELENYLSDLRLYSSHGISTAVPNVNSAVPRNSRISNSEDVLDSSDGVEADQYLMPIDLQRIREDLAALVSVVQGCGRPVMKAMVESSPEMKKAQRMVESFPGMNKARPSWKLVSMALTSSYVHCKQARGFAAPNIVQQQPEVAPGICQEQNHARIIPLEDDQYHDPDDVKSHNSTLSIENSVETSADMKIQFFPEVSMPDCTQLSANGNCHALCEAAESTVDSSSRPLQLSLVPDLVTGLQSQPHPGQVQQVQQFVPGSNLPHVDSTSDIEEDEIFIEEVWEPMDSPPNPTAARGA